MIVSHTWLAEHINDPDIVIIDSRGSVAYSYAHLPNSQGSFADWTGRRFTLV